MANQVWLIGRLTDNPKIQQVNSGHQYCRFSLAVPKQYAKDGEQKVDYINIIAWDKTAENCSKFLSKGSQVAVSGSIQTGSYERDGVKRQTFDILASSVEFLSRPNTEQNKPATPRVTQDASMDDLQEVEDDMPF